MSRIHEIEKGRKTKKLRVFLDFAYHMFKIYDLRTIHFKAVIEPYFSKFIFFFNSPNKIMLDMNPKKFHTF